MEHDKFDIFFSFSDAKTVLFWVVEENGADFQFHFLFSIFPVEESDT